MINTTTLVGRITGDVELRKTQTGKSVVNFTLAVTRLFNKDETDFILVQAWNNTADFMANYVHKGDLLGVVGRIQTSSYDDKQGNRVYKTEVVADNVQALESREQKEARQQSQGYSQPQQYTQPSQQTDKRFNDNPTLDIDSDDLPF